MGSIDYDTIPPDLGSAVDPRAEHAERIARFKQLYAERPSALSRPESAQRLEDALERTETFTLRCTPQEKERWHDESSVLGVSLSERIRDFLNEADVRTDD